MCATNLTSPNPDHFMEVYNEFERTLYDSLEVGKEDSSRPVLMSRL